MGPQETGSVIVRTRGHRLEVWHSGSLWWVILVLRGVQVICATQHDPEPLDFTTPAESDEQL
jgi:hypothetical protein